MIGRVILDSSLSTNSYARIRTPCPYLFCSFSKSGTMTHPLTYIRKDIRNCFLTNIWLKITHTRCSVCRWLDLTCIDLEHILASYRYWSSPESPGREEHSLVRYITYYPILTYLLLWDSSPQQSCSWSQMPGVLMLRYPCLHIYDFIYSLWMLLSSLVNGNKNTSKVFSDPWK